MSGGMKSTDLHSRESIELRVADPEQPTLNSRARKDLQFRTALLSQRRHGRYYPCEGKSGEAKDRAESVMGVPPKPTRPSTE